MLELGNGSDFGQDTNHFITQRLIDTYRGLFPVSTQLPDPYNHHNGIYIYPDGVGGFANQQELTPENEIKSSTKLGIDFPDHQSWYYSSVTDTPTYQNREIYEKISDTGENLTMHFDKVNHTVEIIRQFVGDPYEKPSEFPSTNWIESYENTVGYDLNHDGVVGTPDIHKMLSDFDKKLEVLYKHDVNLDGIVETDHKYLNFDETVLFGMDGSNADLPLPEATYKLPVSNEHIY